MAKKVVTESTDEITLNLIKEVNRRKSEIAQIEKPNWITNCSFSFSENGISDLTNIHVEANIKKLISIVAFLISKRDVYRDAVEALDLPTEEYVFTWGGFKVNEWISDIKTRINKLQIASKKASLEKLETRLNAIISPELRAKMELEAIASELT
jgi:hypothetical protein